MYAGFAEKMWALYCNAGHPVMENIVYQLFFVLCRPNELNFTQLIAVTFFTVRPVDRISRQRRKKSQGGNIFKIQYWMYAATATKKVAATCKLYSHLPRPRKSYRHERRTGRAPSFALLQFGQGKREEIIYFANH